MIKIHQYNDSFKRSLLIIGLLIIIASCNSTTTTMNQQENFNWAGAVTSAKSYPIEVHTGYFAVKDKFITALPKGSVEDQGWAADGQDAGSGGSTIPTQLSLIWVSYAEKKFWKVETDSLPKEKILALFKEGFYNIDRVTLKPKHETYHHIVVAVAPGGVVGVFLTGDWHRVEVAKYQAKETFVDVNAFYDNPHRHTQKEFYDTLFNITVKKEMQQQIKERGIPFGLWDTYRVHYNYRFRMQFYKDDKEEDDRHITYLNGEEERLHGADLTSFLNRPLPWRVNLYFSEKWAETEFNDEELMAAFKELTNANKTEQIEIVGKVGFMYNDMEFWVQAGDKKIPLKKVKVKLWNN